jgi:hypothetical protein
MDPISAAALDLEGHRNLRHPLRGVQGNAARLACQHWRCPRRCSAWLVCTKQSVDGQDGLEGYYYQYDHPLEFEQRLVFARHQEAPLFDPTSAPALPVASWPSPRLKKAHRNYAMDYVRSAAPVMVQLFGPEDASCLLISRAN